MRIIKTNSPEWPYVVLGSLASIVMGGSMPVYAILFGEVLGVLSKDVETARSDSIFYSFMFLVVGVVVGLAMFLQGNIIFQLFFPIFDRKIHTSYLSGI